MAIQGCFLGMKILVLKFLEDFASNFELTELIRFNTEVTRVEVVDSEIIEFVVESKTRGVSSVEVFDAVVVCNGHNTQPHLANDIPGIQTWSKRLHSHNYREPEPFRNQVVVVIGSGPSAIDLGREIGTVAKEVHMSSRSPNVKVSKLERFSNIWQHAKINYIDKDGTVTFEDGSIEADIIFHCTGYKYHVPFLRTNGTINIKDKRIQPLYKHVFPPQFAPRLSFVGIPETGVIFPIIEGQLRWIAKVLSSKVSKDEMLSEVEEHYREMEEKGISRTHSLDFKIELVLEKIIKDMFDYALYCFMTDVYGMRS